VHDLEPSSGCTREIGGRRAGWEDEEKEGSVCRGMGRRRAG